MQRIACVCCRLHGRFCANAFATVERFFAGSILSKAPSFHCMRRTGLCLHDSAPTVEHLILWTLLRPHQLMNFILHFPGFPYIGRISAKFRSARLNRKTPRYLTLLDSETMDKSQTARAESVPGDPAVPGQLEYGTEEHRLVEKRVVRKLDTHLMPLLTALYL